MSSPYAAVESNLFVAPMATMTPMGDEGPTGTTRGGWQPSSRWWILTAVLLLVGGACLVAGIRGHQHPLAGPVATRVEPPTSIGATTTAPATVAPLTTARSIPVELSIPAIGLSVSLSTLGLNADGTVQVPADIQQPGWYRLGPTPGQLGSAVILGHVDSYQGPAVFFRLRTLVAGDRVEVGLADGITSVFEVTSVAMYSKQAFPDQQVYGSHGISALQLVTCGGVFDSQTGHYLSNIVVSTSLVGVTPAPASAAGTAGAM
ncbi:MAG: class F sortase [Acidimicrobiales bacterium]